MNKDQIEGKFEKAKGYVKDKAGELTNDPELETEGEAQRTAGKAREEFGKAREAAGEAVKEVGRKIKGE
jgi:uncharacterized protein YjbJ (UPF0337 family)